MPRSLLASVAIAALAACVPSAAPETAAKLDPLAEYIAGRVAGTPVRCVPTSPSEGLVAIDDRTFIVRAGSTLYVSRSDQRCPGLDDRDTLIVERYGTDLCRGDRVRPLQPGTSIPGPVCFVGDFTPYTKPKS